MALPNLRFGDWLDSMSLGDLSKALLKEVIEADAYMQVKQRAAWREALRESTVLEGLDRLENLGLSEVCFTFLLEPHHRPWLRRIWFVLATLPLGAGWLSQAFAILLQPAQQFRFARPQTRPNATMSQVSIVVSRSEDGRWGVHRRVRGSLSREGDAEDFTRLTP